MTLALDIAIERKRRQCLGYLRRITGIALPDLTIAELEMIYGPLSQIIPKRVSRVA